MAATTSIDSIKASMRTAWMAGDFGVVARTISSGAESFVAGLEVAPGSRVLDVACGTGNLALPLARRGAQVTGVDIAPNLLTQARERAAAEDLPITFDEGDAEQLPYADASFDVVVSMFGAMFAPRPALVATELARVLKPGGRLAMANWTPGGFSGRMFQLMARHVPSPQGIPPPVQWGDAAIVMERLDGCFMAIKTSVVPIAFDLSTDPAGAVDFFRTYFGPTQMAFQRLDQAGQTALAEDLKALWQGDNQAPDPMLRTFVPNEYLQVVASRR